MVSPVNRERFSTLVEIITRLRAPDGCPWDRQQTHLSLRHSFLEECYEVLEALDEADAAKLCDELGDLMMHIVFQAQVAAENGEFGLPDVLRHINDKLVHRHPHIFGEATAVDAAEVAHNWEQLKQAERGDDAPLLASVPRVMPALAYSQEIQRRVASVGFDWPDVEGVIDKLVEEVDEFRQAESPERREEEFGDLLFTLANIGRHLGVNLEIALREANRRFCGRFTRMEETCRQRGLEIADIPFEEQNALWEAVKRAGDTGTETT